MSDPKGKRPMSSSDYIKTQPHLQGKPVFIQQNQFAALAEYPPLSYSKAVTTTTQATPSNPSQKSDYYLKTQKQHQMTTQYAKPITLKDLTQFTTRFFYEDNLYLTDNLVKNRTFYEYILVDSRSVEIVHHPDPKNPNQISYSTCKILRIATMQDLGFITHHTVRHFSQPGFHIQGYSYIDYQNAFLRAFFLRPYTHSWFFSFQLSCPKQIPGWFSEWWYWFGPSDQIYPTEIIKTSYPYYKKFIPQTSTESLSKIHFHIDMGIPWICSWHFNLIPYWEEMPYSLVKEFRVKWWDKYNLDRCSLSNIQKFFKTIKETAQIVQTISKSIPLIDPSQINQEIQQTQETQQQKSPKHQSPKKPKTQPTQTTSPTHSTSSSANSKKQSKKEKLKHFMKEFAKQMMSSSDDEPMQEDEDPFGGPLGQDPFEL